MPTSTRPLTPRSFRCPLHRCESSSGNGNGRNASFRRWKTPAFRGMVKRTVIYKELTPTGSRLSEVICRDMVINANRKIAGTIGTRWDGLGIFLQYKWRSPFFSRKVDIRDKISLAFFWSLSSLTYSFFFFDETILIFHVMIFAYFFTFG